MDYTYICIECRNTSKPNFYKLKCTMGDCEFSDTACFDIVINNLNTKSKFDSYKLGEGNTPTVNISE